jgi:hypothetical protein
MARNSDDGERNAFLFTHLVAMFETLALQQLGKLVSPITGKVERDLRQSRITIDMLVMIREKTAGNLLPEEQRIINAVLTELQMNYLDESNRAEEGPAGDNDEERDTEKSN